MSSIKKAYYRSKKKHGEWLIGYLFLIPSLLGFIVFVALPVVIGGLISLTNYGGFGFPEFVGLQNYINMFSDNYFRISLLNNVIYTVGTVPTTIVLALLLAVLLNSSLRCKTLLKAMFYLPSISSMAIVGLIWVLMYASNGPINSFLISIGVQDPPSWLLSSDTSLLSVMIVAVWKQIGYYMVILLAGLQAIPTYLYEAADIDGAGVVKKFFKITIPMLSPTLFMVTILNIIGSFQVFDLVSIMTEGGPGRSSNVLVYRIYQEGFVNGDFGYASALSYFLLAVIMIITIFQFKKQKDWVTYM